VRAAAGGSQEYLLQHAALHDQLKAGLAGLPAEEGSEPVPMAALAERIKALQAGHHVDAQSERAGKRPAYSAEEPATARIGKRAAAVEACPNTPDSAGQQPPETTHVERLAREEHKEREPGPC
jgi:hypothetical protein